MLVLSYFAGIDPLGWSKKTREEETKTAGKQRPKQSPSAPSKKSLPTDKSVDVTPPRGAPIVADSGNAPGETSANSKTAIAGDNQARSDLHVRPPHFSKNDSNGSDDVDGTGEAETPPVSSELRQRMEAMPAPFVSGTWTVVEDALMTEGIHKQSQLLVFGDPSWTDFDLKVEVIEDVKGESGDKPMSNSILFLADESGQNRWCLDIGAFSDSMHFDLLPFVEGEDAWKSPARRFMPNRLHGRTATWYAVEVQVRQSKVTVIVDGEAVATAEHPSLIRGRVGIGSYHVGRARWRNFEVRTPDGELLWQGLPKLPIGDREIDLAVSPVTPAPAGEVKPTALLVKGAAFSGTFRSWDATRGPSQGETQETWRFTITDSAGGTFSGEWAWGTKGDSVTIVEGTVSSTGILAMKFVRNLKGRDAAVEGGACEGKLSSNGEVVASYARPSANRVGEILGRMQLAAASILPPEDATVSNASASGISQEVPLAESLVNANARYEAAMKSAVARLVKDFRIESKAVSNARLKGDDKVQLLEALEAEREAFETRGRIPWSSMMRLATLRYLAAIAEARALCAKQYDMEMNRLIAAEQTDDAKRILAKKETLLEPKVLGIWNYTWGDRGQTTLRQFYSDGSIDRTDGSWSLSRDVFTLRFPSPQVKEGAWLDTVTVSADGRTFSGKNQFRHKKSGVLRN